MYKKKLIVIINIIIVLVIISWAGTMAASDKASEPYSLTANNINYDYQEEKVYASDEVIFSAENMKITADKLVVDIEKTMVIAEGDKVILRSTAGQLSGNHLEYNYSEAAGKFYGASSKIDRLSFKGEVIEISDGNNYKYSIQNASFTPCILAEPHYQLKAAAVKIYPGDRVTGENITFWWGKTKLLQLPYYVLKYKEGDDGLELIDSIPLPEIAYNSEQGIIMELDYPYQFNSNSNGNIYINLNQAGEREVKINNLYYLKKNLTLKSLYNYDKVIEDDETENLDEMLSAVLNYKLNSNYSIRNELRWEKETENGSIQFDKLLAAGINYSKDNINIDVLAGYNFSREKRQEELLLNYYLNENSKFELSGNYYDEIAEQYSCRYVSSLPVNWELIYRDGYDTDYSPYLKFKLPEFSGIKTELGLGRITDDNLSLDKVHLDFNYDRIFTVFPGFNLNFKENYILNLYNGTDDSYRVLASEIKACYCRQLNNKNKLSAGLSWAKTITAGDYLLDDDKIEEKETAGSTLSLEVLTPQPQSAWILNNSNTYNLLTGNWDNVDLGLVRKYDCYSLQLKYNFIDNVYEFSVNL